MPIYLHSRSLNEPEVEELRHADEFGYAACKVCRMPKESMSLVFTVA